MMRRAGIYVRISKDPEGKALGVERQERDCRKLAKSRGWEVADIYSDNDLAASGRKHRKEWARLLQDIKDGTIDAVVGYTSSRFYRNLRDLGNLIDLADQGQVEVATVQTGDVDLSTARGRTIARINATIDQDQWEVTSELVSRKMQDLAANGQRWGGRRPFGYRIEGKPKSAGGQGQSIVKEPKEARAVRRGADMVLGGANASAVARQWNDKGVLTPSGNRWSVSRVKAVLSRGLIAGLREHSSGTYQGNWDAIVTVEEHEALKALLGRKTGTGRPIARKHPLTGTLVCAECDTPLSGRTQPDGRRNYGCPSGQGGCGRVAVGANAVEDWVLDQVQARDPAYEKKRRLTTPHRVDLEAALELVKVAQDRTTLQEAAALGVDVSVRMRQLDREEHALQDRIKVEPQADDPEKDDPKRRDRRHAGGLTEAEVEQTSDWVRLWVDRVTVRRATSTREVAAGRLKLHWR
jgi:site-specific DNA recombinase